MVKVVRKTTVTTTARKRVTVPIETIESLLRAQYGSSMAEIEWDITVYGDLEGAELIFPDETTVEEVDE